MVGSVALFILLANLLSVFPLFSAPTAEKTVPLGCAIVIFLYFNWQGIKHHTVGYYLLTFAGSPRTLGDWLLGILLFPVELISTAARILSLTVRLWANIFASDLLYVIFLGLLVAPVTWGWEKSPVLGVALGIFPAFIPIAFIGLHIFVAIIQTYVFTLLPSIYIGIATADEH
jgi:F-type H+-transporting ATPase subunit a